MRKRILIINDDQDILELLKIVFRDSGHEVMLRSTSLDPEQILVLHPDLIMIDVIIRGSPVSGADLCLALKSNPATAALPVILCSGRHDLAAIARTSRADTFIGKPFDGFTLLKAVNKFLS